VDAADKKRCYFVVLIYFQKFFALGGACALLHTDHIQHVYDRAHIDLLFTSLPAPSAKTASNHNKKISTATLEKTIKLWIASTFNRSDEQVQVFERKQITSNDLWLIMCALGRHKKKFTVLEL
jgi:hypothetical protein